MNRKFIAQLVIVLVAIFSLASCKKDKEETEQDLAASAQGVYNVYYLKEQGQAYNLPQNGVSATMDVKRTDKDVVTMKFTARNGTQSQNEDLGTVQLKRESSNTVMYSGSDKIGTITNNELEINVKEGAQEYIIKARK